MLVWQSKSDLGSRLEPPAAPVRKPSDADWEVPELQLPLAPEGSSPLSPSATGAGIADGELCAADDADANVAGDGEYAFSACDTDDDHSGGNGHGGTLSTTGGGAGRAHLSRASSPSSSSGRENSSSACPDTGASRALLSALEKVAAEARQSHNKDPLAFTS